MTVAELRAALEALPAGADAWTVIVARDALGNAVRPLRDCTTGLYEPPATDRLRFGFATGEGDFVAAEDLGPTDEEWGPDAVCLWPVR